jgi:hypothetical protein
LPGAGVVAIASVIGGTHVRESRSKPAVLGVDAVADRGAVLHWINENSSDCTRRDVDDIVDRPTALWESSRITRQESEALLAPDRSRRYTGV